MLLEGATYCLSEHLRTASLPICIFIDRFPVNYTTCCSEHLWVIFTLPGDVGSEKSADGHQSPSQVHHQEEAPEAVPGAPEGSSERAPRSEALSLQDASHRSFEDNPETAHRVEHHGSNPSVITVDLTALTNRQCEDEERTSDSPPSVTDVITRHLLELGQRRHSLEDSQGAEDESQKDPEALEAVDCIVVEENIGESSTDAGGSVEEQEDVQSGQDNKHTSETEVWVHQEN